MQEYETTKTRKERTEIGNTEKWKTLTMTDRNTKTQAKNERYKSTERKRK
jgi:hypothetical protein